LSQPLAVANSCFSRPLIFSLCTKLSGGNSGGKSVSRDVPEGRAVSYRAIVYLQPASQKIAKRIGEIDIEPLPPEAPLSTSSKMRAVFVSVKTAEQQSTLLMHRGRELLVRPRTLLANTLRGPLAEFGLIAMQPGRSGVM
jgi:hypothetical protein